MDEGRPDVDVIAVTAGGFIMDRCGGDVATADGVGGVGSGRIQMLVVMDVVDGYANSHLTTVVIIIAGVSIIISR